MVFYSEEFSTSSPKLLVLILCGLIIFAALIIVIDFTFAAYFIYLLLWLPVNLPVAIP